jgi:hypothetical protein
VGVQAVVPGRESDYPAERRRRKLPLPRLEPARSHHRMTRTDDGAAHTSSRAKMAWPNEFDLP